MDQTRICEHHGETAFFKRKEGGWRCRKCSIESVIKRRLLLKKMAVELKGGKCVECGYDKCLAALQFHHLDPTKKDFGITERGHIRSWARIKNELEKCILVCGNCHAEIHDGLRDVSKYLDT